MVLILFLSLVGLLGFAYCILTFVLTGNPALLIIYGVGTLASGTVYSLLSRR